SSIHRRSPVQRPGFHKYGKQCLPYKKEGEIGSACLPSKICARNRASQRRVGSCRRLFIIIRFAPEPSGLTNAIRSERVAVRVIFTIPIASAVYGFGPAIIRQKENFFRVRLVIFRLLLHNKMRRRNSGGSVAKFTGHTRYCGKDGFIPTI